MTIRKLLVSCPKSCEVWPLQLDDETGRLSVSGAAINLHNKCQAMAHHGNVVYVGCRRSDETPFVSTLVRSEGSLEALPDVAPTGGPPTYLSLSPCTKFLLCASYGGNCLSVSRVDTAKRACLSGPPLQCFSGLTKAHSCVYRPQRCDFQVEGGGATYEIWVGCLGLGSVKIFHQDIATGELKEAASLQSSSKSAGPRHIAFHPSLPVAYCVNELNGTIDVFHANDRILLQAVSVFLPGQAPEKPWTADIALTDDGLSLMTSERRTNTIACFAVAPATGTLSVRTIVPTEATQPRGMRLVGDYLLVAGEVSNSVVAYHLGQQGELSRMSAVNVGEGAMWIEVL